MNNEMVLENKQLEQSHTIIWLNTADNHWWAILQSQTNTHYYDIKRAPHFDDFVSRFHAKMKLAK